MIKHFAERIVPPGRSVFTSLLLLLLLLCRFHEMARCVAAVVVAAVAVAVAVTDAIAAAAAAAAFFVTVPARRWLFLGRSSSSSFSSFFLARPVPRQRQQNRGQAVAGRTECARVWSVSTIHGGTDAAAPAAAAELG